MSISKSRNAALSGKNKKADAARDKRVAKAAGYNPVGTERNAEDKASTANSVYRPDRDIVGITADALRQKGKATGGGRSKHHSSDPSKSK